MICTECIDLTKGKKEAEDANGPLTSDPSFFKGGCTMTEVIGVIYSMAEIKVIGEGFHVGKLFFTPVLQRSPRVHSLSLRFNKTSIGRH